VAGPCLWPSIDHLVGVLHASFHHLPLRHDAAMREGVLATENGHPGPPFFMVIRATSLDCRGQLLLATHVRVWLVGRACLAEQGRYSSPSNWWIPVDLKFGCCFFKNPAKTRYRMTVCQPQWMGYPWAACQSQAHSVSGH